MMCSGFKILKPSVIIVLRSLSKHRHWPETFSFLQSIEGMKVICHELTQAADPESTMLEDLIKEADRLASCLAVMVSLCCAIHVTFSLHFHGVHTSLSYLLLSSRNLAGSKDLQF